MEKNRNKFIGVTSLSDFAKCNLRKQLIFYDQIGLTDSLDRIKSLLYRIDCDKKNNPPNVSPEVIEDFELLFKKNILVKMPEISQIDVINMDKVVEQMELKKLAELEDKSSFNIKLKDPYVYDEEHIKFDEVFSDMIYEYHQIRENIVRINSIGFADFIFIGDEYKFNKAKSPKTKVASIVIQNLPVPSSELLYKDIISWVNEDDIKKLKLLLRRWVNKTAKLEASESEIQEEIEYLINEFTEFMKINKIKYETATLKSVIKIPLEILEDLIKIKWSKIADLIFSMKELEINLLEAEIKAPGRELAYIVKANERFGK